MAEEVAAEFVESGESNAAFEEDTRENAQKGGVDMPSMDDLGKGAQLVLQIYNLYRQFKNSAADKKESKKKRYISGILYYDENRDNLVKEGSVSAYYSTSNIKKLLRNNVLPYGWGELTTVNQGFGDEVSAGHHRKENYDQSKRLKKEREHLRTSNKMKNVSDLFHEKLKDDRLMEIIRSNLR